MLAVPGPPAFGQSLREKSLAARPLATSAVTRQQPGGAVASGNAAPAPVSMTTTSAATSPQPYQPAPRSDWAAGQVDRQDPWIRLTASTPAGPLVIDVAVFVDAEPFREIEEAALDQLQRISASVGSDELTEEAPIARVATELQTESQPADDDLDHDDVPTVDVAQRPSWNLRQRVAAYVNQADGVSREELRWLVQQWTAGPSPQIMRDEYAWQRAGLAPLLATLDADGDGGLSEIEIAAAETRLDRIDSNGDEVIELGEAMRELQRVQVELQPAGGPVLHVLDATAGSGAAVPAEADVVLRVDFATDEGQLQLLAVNERRVQWTEGERGLILDQGNVRIEWSAVDSTPLHRDQPWPVNVSIGAAWEGYPLWRVADRDGDDRITMRERRTLSASLRDLDRDGDGRLDDAELRGSLRIVLCRGLVANDVLAVRAPAVGLRTRPASHAAPEWFAAMDVNRDGDLARSEFPGSTEQFDAYDRDNDGLISAAEAAADSVTHPK